MNQKQIGEIYRKYKAPLFVQVNKIDKKQILIQQQQNKHNNKEQYLTKSRLNKNAINLDKSGFRQLLDQNIQHQEIRNPNQLNYFIGLNFQKPQQQFSVQKKQNTEILIQNINKNKNNVISKQDVDTNLSKQIKIKYIILIDKLKNLLQSNYPNITSKAYQIIQKYFQQVQKLNRHTIYLIFSYHSRNVRQYESISFIIKKQKQLLRINQTKYSQYLSQLQSSFPEINYFMHSNQINQFYNYQRNLHLHTQQNKNYRQFFNPQFLPQQNDYHMKMFNPQFLSRQNDYLMLSFKDQYLKFVTQNLLNNQTGSYSIQENRQENIKIQNNKYKGIKPVKQQNKIDELYAIKDSIKPKQGKNTLKCRYKQDWTRQQYKKYCIFLGFNLQKVWNKKVIFRKQCSQYVFNGNQDKYKKKHRHLFRTTKDANIVINRIKKSFKFTQQQIKQQETQYFQFRQRKIRQKIRQRQQFINKKSQFTKFMDKIEKQMIQINDRDIRLVLRTGQQIKSKSIKYKIFKSQKFVRQHYYILSKIQFNNGKTYILFESCVIINKISEQIVQQNIQRINQEILQQNSKNRLLQQVQYKQYQIKYKQQEQYNDKKEQQYNDKKEQQVKQQPINSSEQMYNYLDKPINNIFIDNNNQQGNIIQLQYNNQSQQQQYYSSSNQNQFSQKQTLKQQQQLPSSINQLIQQQFLPSSQEINNCPLKFNRQFIIPGTINNQIKQQYLDSSQEINNYTQKFNLQSINYQFVSQSFHSKLTQFQIINRFCLPNKFQSNNKLPPKTRRNRWPEQNNIQFLAFLTLNKDFYFKSISQPQKTVFKDYTVNVMAQFIHNKNYIQCQDHHRQFYKYDYNIEQYLIFYKQKFHITNQQLYQQIQNQLLKYKQQRNYLINANKTYSINKKYKQQNNQILIHNKLRSIQFTIQQNINKF